MLLVQLLLVVGPSLCLAVTRVEVVKSWSAVVTEVSNSNQTVLLLVLLWTFSVADSSVAIVFISFAKLNNFYVDYKICVTDLLHGGRGDFSSNIRSSVEGTTHSFIPETTNNMDLINLMINLIYPAKT